MNGGMKRKYKKINNWTIKAGIKVKKHHMNLNNAYALTLVKSEVCPKDRNDLWKPPEETIKHKKSKHMPMINGDFNVKTDSGYPQYKDEIGKSGKKTQKQQWRCSTPTCKRKETDSGKYHVQPENSTLNNKDI